MGFFDLNVPYNQEEERSLKLIPATPEQTKAKTNRLKIVVKLMELGYSGIAYTRSIKSGTVLSDSDFCTIPLFPLSSLLKITPSLSSNVKFHKQLLGVPETSPFRQYTRLTINVDSLIQCSSLNSSNPVLKTYDLVAARPLNQPTFDHVCKYAEVDIIAIDFSQWVPFRIKYPILQAVIKRGIYFEITYSSLLSDVQARKQMVYNTKLLMQWTRGKNLIFSSAAPSVCEIRGPYDVANLSCLLGLSMERAKAAIFKNSRSLLLNTVRKKQYFKNAIRIERISPIKPVDSKEAWFCDGNGWDHISSGEGDLLLDDIAKSFASTVKVTKTSKASDVAPVFDEISSHDIHLKDLCPGSGGELHQPNVSSTKELKDSHEVFKQLNELELVPIAGAMLLASTPLQHQSSGCQDFPNTPPVFTDDMEIEILANGLEKDKDSCCTVPITVEFVSHGKVSKDSEHNCAENHVSREDAITLVTPMEDIESSVQHVDPRGSSDLDMVSSSFIDISTIESDVRAAMNTLEHSTPANEIAPYSSNEDDKRLNGVDVVLDTGGVRIMEVLGEDDKRETTRLILAGCDMFTDSGYSNREKNEPPKYSAVPHDDKMLGVSFSENQAYVNSAKFLQHEDTSVESDDQKQFKSGIGRSMRRIFPRGFQFALKRFLHPMLFKKKSRSYSKKSKQNICSGELQSAKCGRKCDPIMKDRFIELCLLELNNGGRLGETLKPSSWTRIEKEMKRKFGVSYKKRQWKTNLELLKQQYHICVDLTKKVGYGYNVASNAIDWSPEMWEKYEKTRSEAKQFRRQRLQYADDLASLLDDIVESRA